MAQASPTLCAHNAEGQVTLPGRPTACRQCGAQIQPTPRTENNGALVPSAAVNAAYPGDGRTADTTWAFAQ